MKRMPEDLTRSIVINAEKFARCGSENNGIYSLLMILLESENITGFPLKRGVNMEAAIEDRVHELYWTHDINCARTMLTCLCEIFHVYLEEQTIFGSLSCYDLRPNGFSENDPPHVCERLTVNAIEFAREFTDRVQLEFMSDYLNKS